MKAEVQPRPHLALVLERVSSMAARFPSGTTFAVVKRNMEAANISRNLGFE